MYSYNIKRIGKISGETGKGVGASCSHSFVGDRWKSLEIVDLLKQGERPWRQKMP